MKTKAVVLPPTRPNAGVAARYRARMDALVDEMDRSLAYWIKAAWRATPPDVPMALDAAPDVAAIFQRLMKRLGRQWQERFDDAAPKMAEWFTRRSMGTAERGYSQILKDAGFTVEFRPSPVVRQAYEAAINENVTLISSLPAEHISKVSAALMRSVSAGRDLGSFAKHLEEQAGVTKRRAALIARDQNNKATAVIVRTRQLELGITKARWKHSHAGKHPRPSHVAADGKIYDVAKGMHLDGKWTHPGEEINCRCTSESIIPGLEDL